MNTLPETVTSLIDVRQYEEEGEFPVDDLLGSHEAFLASTVREVQAVAAIDGHELETGPGTLEAHEAFERVLEETLGAPQSTARA